MARLNDAGRCNVSGHAAGDAVGVPEHERTWKNVGKMAPGYLTTVVVKFLMVDTGEAYPFDATAEPGYVYHCHVRTLLITYIVQLGKQNLPRRTPLTFCFFYSQILDHEDNAMIRPLKLIR